MSGIRTRSIDGTDHRRLARRESIRHLRRFGIGVATLVSVSGTARSHGSIGHGGEPVAFALVVGLPVLAGLVSGTVVVTNRWGRWAHRADHRAGVVFGILLVALGVMLAMPAVTESRQLGMAIGLIGVLMALWTGSHVGTLGRVEPAEMTLGAISVHRFVEGVALGALYNNGIVLGLVATVVIACHTAIESAAVGGLYNNIRYQAIGAVVLIQIGYVVGALVGVGGAILVPTAVQIGSTAMAGGILLGIGLHETHHSIHGGARERLV